MWIFLVSFSNSCYFFVVFKAKIQHLKHSIPKGDKKKKKDVTAEIAILEVELSAAHEKELLAIRAKTAFAEVSLTS